MNKKTNVIANVSAKVLRNVLVSEANSASCGVFYQPEAPKRLGEFKMKKK